MAAMGGRAHEFRKIPSVDQLLNDLGAAELARPLIAELARDLTRELRQTGVVASYPEILARLRSQVDGLSRSRLQPVINATGICLHTNLGRAPLAEPAVRKLAEVVGGYCNLEYDPVQGSRSRRGEYAELCLKILTGSQAVIVVNNCAAALLLILHQTVREGKPEAVISRGDLVQIGGGFRIPDILRASGAVMREVGTTNRTTLADYRNALNPQTGMILRIHRSNFYMEGFVEIPALKELAGLGAELAVPVVFDQGSGAMLPPAGRSLQKEETTPPQALADGVQLTCFSGDKLFGGPQAGIVAGDAARISALRHNPLYRALRPDKLTLAALETTVETYLNTAKNRAPELPALTALGADVAPLQERGRRILAQVPTDALPIELEDTLVETGGGTMPRTKIPSVALAVATERETPVELARFCRLSKPPVVGYVAKNRFYLDLRTVFPDQDLILIDRLTALASWVTAKA